MFRFRFKDALFVINKYNILNEKPFSKIFKNNQGADYIQYPAKLLESKREDCDELTAPYASLLECSGFKTALVSAKDYITLMFNTEIQQENQSFLLCGDLLCAIRNRSIYILVEITEISNSFFVAWQVGDKRFHKSEHDDDLKFIRISGVENNYKRGLPQEL